MDIDSAVPSPSGAPPSSVDDASSNVRVAIAMEHALARSALSQLVSDAEDLRLVPDRSEADVVVVDLDRSPTSELTASASKRAAVVGLTASTTPGYIVDALRRGVVCAISAAAPPDELL